MSDELDLEMVDLGDAKEQTKGLQQGIEDEANETAPFLYPVP
ncbi:MAG TPA: rubrivinodin family lasso peptide [Roseateles sp.]